MANKTMKRCSIFLDIREIQIKTVMGYTYTCIKIAQKKRKIPNIPKVGENVEQLELSYAAGGKIK